MASLVLDSHRLVSHAESKIFKAYDDQKFLIDKNSSITNIDVISENFNFNRISEKSLFQPSGLTTTESIYNILKSSTVFLRLLRRDVTSTFQGTNFDEFFSTTSSSSHDEPSEFGFTLYLIVTLSSPSFQ